MKTRDVFAVFGSQAAVARLLGLQRAAVNRWGENVPEINVFRLRERRPTIDREILELRDARSRRKRVARPAVSV